MRVLGSTTLMALGTVSALAGQSAVQLVDDVLEAHGGRERLEAVLSFEVHGTTEAITTGRTGPLLRILERPDRLRVEILYPGRAEVRILDGDEGWRSDGAGAMIRAPGALHASMILQAARMAAPWILLDHRDAVRILPTFEYQGRSYAGLEVVLSEGLVLRAYVDPATKLIVRTQTLLNVGGLQTGFETIHTEFEEIEGVMFPVAEQNFAAGVHTARTRIDSIVINPNVPDETFSDPLLLLRKRQSRSR